MLRAVKTAYSENYIDSVTALSVDGKVFICFNSDEHRLTEEVYVVLQKIASDPDFDSPVYISFGEMGELLLDA